MTREIPKFKSTLSLRQQEDKIAEQLEEMYSKITQRYFEELERELVKALNDGYDGFDVHVTTSGKTEFHPWNGSPPQYGLHDAPAERFYLTGVTFSDLRESSVATTR